MKYTMVFILILSSLVFAESSLQKAMTKIGMTNISILEEVPDFICGAIVVLCTAIDDELDYSLNGEDMGEINPKTLKIYNDLLKINEVLYARDSDGKPVLVIHSSPIVLLVYDVGVPSLNKIGITRMIQMLREDGSTKQTLKFFIR